LAKTKLQDSELKIMDLLWDSGDMTAKDLASKLGVQIGWNKNTTYTLIKRCIDKKAIERIEPNFLCHALISKQQVQEVRIDELVEKIFDGSRDKLFACLLNEKDLSDNFIEEMKQFILSKK
jgi:Predicted transcriptional regulator